MTGSSWVRLTSPGYTPSETFNFPVTLNEDFTNESGISSVDVTVTIDDTKLTTREFTVDNIQMINKPDGYNAELVTESRLVTVRGPEEAVNALYQSQLRIVVDLSQAQLATGRQTVQAQVIIDGSSECGRAGRRVRRAGQLHPGRITAGGSTMAETAGLRQRRNMGRQAKLICSAIFAPAGRS